MRLENKIAVITGAGSGMGKAMAEMFVKEGAKVVCADISGKQNEVAAALGDAAIAIHTDVAKTEDVQKMIQAAEDHFGRLDVLCNNAGFGGHGVFTERDLASDLGMIDLNVKSLVSLSHMVGRDMAARGSGKILNVSSTAAYMPGPLQATYFATKAFVSSFSQAMDQELRAKGVTVTALEPGFVRTEFAATADLEGTGLVKQTGATPDTVAKYGYDAMQAGKLRAINEGKLRLMLGSIVPMMPRRAVLKMVQGMQEK